MNKQSSIPISGRHNGWEWLSTLYSKEGQRYGAKHGTPLTPHFNEALTPLPYHTVSMDYSQTIIRSSHAPACQGDRAAAKTLLLHYSRSSNTETFRARWDGAAALLNWWHTQAPGARPPLNDFNEGDALTFIRSLEARGLARSTIKSYRIGASDLIKAIRWSQDPSRVDAAYRPFRDARPLPKPMKVPAVDEVALAALPDVRARAKINALLSLLTLGVSIPEACARYWSDLHPEQRRLVGYSPRQIVIGDEAVEALAALWRVIPQTAQSKDRRVFCWSADTARRYLNSIRKNS